MDSRNRVWNDAFAQKPTYMIRDPRDNHNEIKGRKHVGTVERLDMSRINVSRSEMI
jgi:hypothetical protein